MNSKIVIACVLSLMWFLSTDVVAQDVIYTTNGTTIDAEIIEITDVKIRYKKFDFPDGPTRSIALKLVLAIDYENGTRETFNDDDNGSVIDHSPRAPVERRKRDITYRGRAIMIGAGTGPSYGGLVGVRGQVRWGGVMGFGIHGGLGVSIADHVSDPFHITPSAGVKLFPYKGVYLNYQYGGTHFACSNSDCEIQYGSIYTGGVDWLFGRKQNFGFNAGIGASSAGYLGWSIVSDLGFVYQF